MSRVVVTGATGFVGNSVVQRLTGDGRTVVCAVRRHDALLPSGVTKIVVDGLSPRSDWLPALRNADAVVHCAALAQVLRANSADALTLYREADVAGTLALARQAAAAGVRRFVFVSSIKVNGEESLPGRPFRAEDASAPEDAYGISKREAEEGLQGIAQKTGMEVVIVRPPLVYGAGASGNFAALMRWVAGGLPLPLGAVRGNRRSMVALDNLVDFILTCLNHPAAANEVFLISDGEDYSTSEWIEQIAVAMRRPPRLVSVPVWLLEGSLAMLGKREVARKLCHSLQVDISKARERLGWSPPVPVAEGLRRAVASQVAGRLA